MMLAFLPLVLVLMLSNLANAAAIPSTSLRLPTHNPAPADPEWSGDETSQPLSVQRTSRNTNTGPRPLAKRTPYYFPETVPDEQDLAGRLAALREAGFIPSASLRQTPDQIQSQKSIGTPDAGIDTPHARVLMLPDRVAISESHSNGETWWESGTEWATASLFPPLHFLVVMAAVACVVAIVTIVQGVRRGTQ